MDSAAILAAMTATPSKIHKRAKMLIGVEWILGLGGTILILLTLMFYLSGPNEQVAPLLKYRPYVVGNNKSVDMSPEAIEKASIYVAVLTISVLVSSMVPVSLSILLAMGITQKSIFKCKLWMALHLLVFFGCLGIFAAEIVHGGRFHLAVYICVGVFILIRLLVMKFVINYMTKLKEEENKRFRDFKIPIFRTIKF